MCIPFCWFIDLNDVPQQWLDGRRGGPTWYTTSVGPELGGAPNIEPRPMLWDPPFAVQEAPIHDIAGLPENAKHKLEEGLELLKRGKRERVLRKERLWFKLLHSLK